MREHPILFSAPMVRAILDGRKTQTRRVVTWANSTVDGQSAKPMWPQLDWTTAEWRETTTLDDAIYGPDAPSDPHIRIRNIDGDSWHRVRSKIEAGDKLWVRETWQTKQTQHCVCPQPSEPSPCDGWMKGIGCQSGERQVAYAASGDKAPCWRPSIFMPRWASRITLEVTGVRAERVKKEYDREPYITNSRIPCVILHPGPGANTEWYKSFVPFAYGTCEAILPEVWR